MKMKAHRHIQNTQDVSDLLPKDIVHEYFTKGKSLERALWKLEAIILTTQVTLPLALVKFVDYRMTITVPTIIMGAVYISFMFELSNWSRSEKVRELLMRKFGVRSRSILLWKYDLFAFVRQIRQGEDELLDKIVIMHKRSWKIPLLSFVMAIFNFVISFTVVEGAIKFLKIVPKRLYLE